MVEAEAVDLLILDVGNDSLVVECAGCLLHGLQPVDTALGETIVRKRMTHVRSTNQ